MNKRSVIAAITGASMAFSVSSAGAAVLFSDSLQVNLNSWTSYYSDVSIVAAPGGGNAATWSKTEGGGDFYTNSSFSTSTGSFTVSFQVYGNCGHTSNCGLFLATEPPGTDVWLLSDTAYYDLYYGTIANFPEINHGWENVSYTFQAYGGNSTYLDFEDWNGSKYTSPNSFYLRDVVLTNNSAGVAVGTLTVSSVPEPTTWAMMLLGFAGLGFAGYRVSRRSVAFAA